MPNPAILLCDSDVLVQFFLGNEIRPLKHLKDAYNIQPAIVQEVDLELRWLGKHKDRFVPPLEKGLKSGVLQLLDPGFFQSLMSAAPVGASWAGFQSLGAQYEGRIDRGEAYTFAAAVTLGVPALSNDFNAIKTLENNLLSLPTPVLRCFDLLAFCYQNGSLIMKACEDMRSELLRNREGIPKVFQHSSFKDGLNNFSPRLRDGTGNAYISGNSYSATLYIVKV